MFVACGIWCLADVSSVSPSSESYQPLLIKPIFSVLAHAKNSFFKTSLPMFLECSLISGFFQPHILIKRFL